MRFTEILKGRNIAKKGVVSMKDMKMSNKIKAETLTQLNAILGDNDKVMLEISEDAVPFFLDILDDPAFDIYIFQQMVVKKTQSARIKEIAKVLDLPEVTVKRVIDEYIASLQYSIIQGEDIEVRGVFQVSAEEIGGRIVPRGTVSPALKERAKRGYI